jgi:hypothetical protein
MNLINILANPPYCDLSDEAAFASLSVPTKTPRADRITITALAAGNVWGFEKTAAFENAMQAAADAGNANARTLLSMLRGAGLSPSDPQAAALAPAFVAMGNGSITDDDVSMALYSSISYPAGDAFPPTMEDIQAARARLVPIMLLEQANRDRYNAAAERLANLCTSVDPVPATISEVDAMGEG